MKVPELNKVESLALIGAIGVAIYAGYKIYKVGDSAKQSVVDTVSGIGDAVTTTYKKIFPSTPPKLDTLPSNDNYPENSRVRYESTHATPDEIKEYFPVMSPDAMGN